MRRSYPSRNPFPYQAAVSDNEDSDSHIPASDTPTVALTAIDRLVQLTQEYIDRFDPDARKRGQVVALRGEPGSGKTHTIFYSRRVKYSSNRTKYGEPIQLYANARDAQLLKVYSSLLKCLDLAVLKTVSDGFAGAVAGEELRQQNPSSDAATTDLRDKPEQVQRLIDQAVIDKGKIEERQEGELRKVAGTGAEDLQRAMPFLSGVGETADVAFRWLTADALSADEIRRLGVSGPITAQTGRSALRLVTRLFRRAGKPLIMYLDQYENLVNSSNSTANEANIGWLQGFLEDAAAENCMVVLAGNEEAWAKLPDYIRSRVPDLNLLTLATWTQKEARRVVQLYLDPANAPAPDPTEDDLFPFTSDAVRQILQYSSGNIRRFLQLCATVFDKAHTDELIIGPDLVKKTLEEGGSQMFFTPQSVRQEIQRLLLGRTLRFQTNIDFEGVPVDFSVLFPDGSPRLLIRTSRALFWVDETDLVLSHLNLIKKIHDRQYPTRFVLIVLGYMSPHVTPAITPFVHELIVYRTDTFAKQFTSALDRMPDTVAAPAQAAPDVTGEFEKRFSALQESIERLRIERQEETQVLRGTGAGLVVSHEVERERWRAWRTQWAVERSKIESEIRMVRAEQKAADLKELETLRARAERTWQLRAAAIGLGVGVGLWLLAFLLASGNSSFGLFVATFWLVFPAIGLLTGVILAYRLVGFQGARELAAEVTSRSELDRAASTFNARHRPTKGMLFNSNPHFRYAAAVHEKLPPAEYAIRAVKAERSAIIRRALARALGKTAPMPNPSDSSSVEWQEQVDGTIGDLPEMVFLVEMAPSLGSRFANSPAAAVLASLYREDGFSEYRNPAVDLAHSIGFGGDSLADAFRGGLNSETLGYVPPWSDLEIRRAMEVLSPFDDAGLGRQYELRKIGTIDEMYIFFRNIQFLRTREQ